MIFLIILLLIIDRAYSLRAEWIKDSPSNMISPRRSGHTAFCFEGCPYVLGGYAEEDGVPPRRYVTNDLWKWADNDWTKVSQSGQVPRERLVSASAVIGKKAYLFGGWDPGTKGDGGEILDTVHELNLESMRWSQLDARVPGGPTSRHVCCVIRDRIILHNHRCIDYILQFNPSTEKFSKITTTGACPSSRGLHAMAKLPNDDVVVFGGAAQAGTMSNELFRLDTKTWVWEKLAGGTGPSPRAAPCLVALSDTQIVVFGGAETTQTGLNPLNDLWLFDLVSKKWSRVSLDSNGADLPPPRNAATLSALERSESKQSFLLTGGWAPFRETWDDCYRLVISM